MRFFIPLLLILNLAACSAGSDGSETKAVPAQHATGVILSESEMGLGNWLLQAREANFYSEPHSFITMVRPHLIFKIEGREESSIKSREGRYDIDKNLITMTGRVVGVSLKENAKIETEKVFYDTQTKQIWVNAPVVITRAGVRVEGKGLRATPDLSEIEIFKQKTTLPQNIQDLEAGPALKL